MGGKIVENMQLILK